MLTDQDEVAYAKRTSLHEDGGHVSAALVKGCLDYCTLGQAVGVGFEVKDLRLEKHFFKKLVDVESLLGRDVLRLDFAAPIFNEQVHAGKLFLDALGVGVGAIDLVDGKNDGYVGRLGVTDGFLGLGHDRIVGRNHNNGNVGNLSTTGSHGREGLVTGSIQKGDVLIVVEFHAVGTDVLGNSARFSGNDVGLADVVQK